MRKCKHRCWYDVASVDILNEAEPRVSLLGQRRCLGCGEVVPYAPAWDDGEHAQAVAVEIQAAEWAAVLDFGYWRPGLTCAEMRGGTGWNAAELGFADTWCNGDPDCLAGHLARSIACHEEG